MLTRGFQSFFVLAVSLGIAACTDDGSFTVDLDPETTIDSLTDEQAIDLCVSLFEHYDDVHGADATLRAACLALSLAADDEAAYGEDFETCLETYGGIVVREHCATNITAIREGCTAKVADIQACADATTDLYGDVLSLTCAEAPRTDGVGLIGSPEPCATLPGTCNSFVGQSSR